MPTSRMVFIKDDQIYAELITEGAHASRIRYTYGGVLYDVLIENDELEFLDDDTDWETQWNVFVAIDKKMN